MIIKKCTKDEEIKVLAQLAHKIWNEYFIDLISQQQIAYMVEQFQSYPALSKAIKQDHYTYFLAYDDEEMIGYCGVQPQVDGRLFLSKLYLQKESRGKGYASNLLASAISFAKEQGLNAIYLTCNKYNTHSLDVYKKKGFYQIDSIVTDIGHGFLMDDYVLQLDL